MRECSVQVGGGAARWLGGLVVLMWLAGCQSLPDRAGIVPAYKQDVPADSALASAAAVKLREHPGQSGVSPLDSGVDALLARLALVDAAEYTLDLQYYIWHPDKTGRILSHYLVEAANRGVRVRLLLDDVGSPVGDDVLLMLNQHPNIEVRLFNPVANRGRRLWSSLTDFSRVNRRMHNKSLTADNTLTIVGGRNIGNEYFEANDDVSFADLDVIAVGPVVDEVSNGFDLYWNHTHTYPIHSFTDRVFTEQELDAARAESEAYADEVRTSDYAARLKAAYLRSQEEDITWFWGEAHALFDHPDKAQGEAPDDGALLSNQLSGVFAQVERELLLVSPYFVPGKEGVQYLESLRERGVQVTIVTNSLAATDVGVVHSGYAKYRKDLLQAGVVLYEVRADAETSAEKVRHAPAYVGSSAQASLHAKAFFLDRKTTFIGSMNLDPRSFHLNTEIGIVIDSPPLTGMAFDDILAGVASSAFLVRLNEHGDLEWVTEVNGQPVIETTEPGVSAWRRFGVWFMGLFPIESQL